MCYYLTGSYNASFVLVLSILTANTAGHTKKVVMNAMIFLGDAQATSQDRSSTRLDRRPRIPWACGR